MQNANAHLDTERLAALDHDAPTTDELAHLASCAVCRAERAAHQALAAMATSVRMPNQQQSPRLTQWESLSKQLRHEGLLASHTDLSENDVSAHTDVPLAVPAFSAEMDSPMRAITVTPLPRRMPMWLRAAAAMVLVLGGGLLGRLTASAPSAMLATAPASASSDSESFGSVQRASEILYRAQRDYERASLWLASNDTTAHSSDVYRARLAALDQMMASSRAALRDAPSDPILNHYFQTASTAREATLKQLSIALPLDKTLERY